MKRLLQIIFNIPVFLLYDLPSQVFYLLRLLAMETKTRLIQRKQQALEIDQVVSKEELAYNAGREYLDYDRVHPEILSLHNAQTFKGRKLRYNINTIMEYIMMQYGRAWITQTWQQGGTKIVPILEPQYEQYFWQGIYDKILETYAPETYNSDDAKDSALQWSQAYQQAIQEVK